MALLLISDPLAPLELELKNKISLLVLEGRKKHRVKFTDLLALLPLFDLAVFRLVPCRDSFEVIELIAWISTLYCLNLSFRSMVSFGQTDATQIIESTLTLLDVVLDLTTLPLPGTDEEEELFPDFSVLGSFNLSTPSASLFLTRDLQCHC